jgi:hypothetical protein
VAVLCFSALIVWIYIQVFFGYQPAFIKLNLWLSCSGSWTYAADRVCKGYVREFYVYILKHIVICHPCMHMFLSKTTRMPSLICVDCQLNYVGVGVGGCPVLLNLNLSRFTPTQEISPVVCSLIFSLRHTKFMISD